MPARFETIEAHVALWAGGSPATRMTLEVDQQKRFTGTD
jgi:hypothetical protein